MIAASWQTGFAATWAARLPPAETKYASKEADLPDPRRLTFRIQVPAQIFHARTAEPAATQSRHADLPRR
eukprot:4114711-Alexandrium_andersonii.AAC.1